MSRPVAQLGLLFSQQLTAAFRCFSLFLLAVSRCYFARRSLQNRGNPRPKRKFPLYFFGNNSEKQRSLLKGH